MKMRALLFLIAAGTLLHAQNATDDQKLKYSWSLAVKLYPDVQDGNSAISAIMKKMDGALRARNSPLAGSPEEPIILASVAADALKIAPKWDDLTEREKAQIYYALSDGLLMTNDLLPPPGAPRQAQAGAKPFNPGSIEGDVTRSTEVAPSSSQNLDPSLHDGYVYYYNTIANQGHLATDRHTVVRFYGGPFDGMTKGDSQNYAQKQWEAMSHDDQLAYAQKAQMYGPGPTPGRPESDGNYNVNVTHDPNQ